MDELNCWGRQHATAKQRNDKATEIVDLAFATLRPRLVSAIAVFWPRGLPGLLVEPD